MKTLVDEFSHFARLPAAQPVPSDLNEVVENALAVFAGRLDEIEVRKNLASGLPLVNIDREQFKRLVVNLIDNAAEAMRDSHGETAVRRNLGDRRRLCGVDRRRHGLRYLASTIKRNCFCHISPGTQGVPGLGLAIVNHIVSEHGAKFASRIIIRQGRSFIVGDRRAGPRARTQ